MSCGVGKGETLADDCPDDCCDDLRLRRTGLLLEFRAVLATKAVFLRLCFGGGSLWVCVPVSGVGGLEDVVRMMFSPALSEIKIRVVFGCSACVPCDFFRMGGRRV